MKTLVIMVMTVAFFSVVLLPSSAIAEEPQERPMAESSTSEGPEAPAPAETGNAGWKITSTSDEQPSDGDLNISMLAITIISLILGLVLGGLAFQFHLKTESN